jgi:acyl-coenzyme A thioesterase PaaI-like protein
MAERDDATRDRPAEAAGPVDRAGHTTETRLAAAAALRRLAHSVVAHQVDDQVLERVRQAAVELTSLVETAPPRPNALLFQNPLAPRSEGATLGFPDGLVGGQANPMGLGAAMRREGDEAVLRVTLGRAFEGAPGRSHGGVVATLLDETMGMVLSIVGSPAFTGRLTVNYRRPTPINRPLVCRARLLDREGRKLTIGAELHDGDQLLADAEGLFVTVNPQNFVSAGD